MIERASSLAVLLSCHGTIAEMSDVPAFLGRIRRGRPAPQELVDEVVRRYRLIGGSPLMEHSTAQARALEQRLGLPVRVAGRLWHPFPEEVLGELVRQGVTQVLSLPLAPQSVHVYNEAVREAAKDSVAIVAAPAWGNEPALIDAFLEVIDEGLATHHLSQLPPQELPILLTAHSLPTRVLAAGDSYETDFRAMAALVAARLEQRGYATEVAFQSQGASSEAWLGPDLRTRLAAAVERGASAAFIAPIGFVAEHVETLYDLDIEAQEIARAVGLKRLGRAPAVGDRARFIDALEAVARRALVGHASPPER